MADFFHVTEQTVNNWKDKHPEFFESLRQGKIEADANVASSLYERSLGVTCSEEKVVTTDTDGESRTIKTATKKEYPPDTQAMRLWLLNRRPGQWSETSHIRVENTQDSRLIVQLSPELTEKLAKAAGESLDFQVIEGECEPVDG